VWEPCWSVWWNMMGILAFLFHLCLEFHNCTILNCSFSCHQTVTSVSHSFLHGLTSSSTYMDLIPGRHSVQTITSECWQHVFYSFSFLSSSLFPPWLECRWRNAALEVFWAFFICLDGSFSLHCNVCCSIYRELKCTN